MPLKEHAMASAPSLTPFIPSSAVEDKTIAMKGLWDKAPSRPRKSVALKHYQAAQKVNAVKDHAACYGELDATAPALA